MAKQSGLGDRLFVGGYDLSGDIGSLGGIAGGPDPLEVTGIDKSGMERIGGKRDGSIEFMAYFNDASGQAHPRLASLPATDVILSYCRGTTLGNAGAALVAKQLNYDGSRNEDGSLTFKVNALANGYGLEWGRQLTAGKRTDGSATNGTGVDFAAASSFGLQAYLQVFAFTGTSVTVKLQESSDNGGGDAFADVVGGAFTIATGITTERIATSSALAVERYLRVVTTGTFSNAVFAVLVVRNDTAPAF
jgi:hypothetical protein